MNSFHSIDINLKKTVKPVVHTSFVLFWTELNHYIEVQFVYNTVYNICV